jgi:hypothetical protein
VVWLNRKEALNHALSEPICSVRIVVQQLFELVQRLQLIFELRLFLERL